MGFELIEDLVYLFGHASYGEAGHAEIARLHCGNRGPIVVVITSNEEVIGIDAHYKTTAQRTIEGTANTGPITRVDQHWQAEFGEIVLLRCIHVVLSDKVRIPRPDSARYERRNVQLLPDFQVQTNSYRDFPWAFHRQNLLNSTRAVLYAARVSAYAPKSRVRAWKPPLTGVDEVLHASFFGHAYPVHSHANWTLLIMDAGEVRYDLHHHDRAADMNRVTILPPHVPHDGRSARPERGFKKRVLYVDTETIPESLVGRAVDRSAVHDPSLRRSISHLHNALLQPKNDLEWESRLALVVERIGCLLLSRPEATADQSPGAAAALRDYLDSQPFERHDLDEVARSLGWNKTHLIRAFAAAFGLPPHRYLIGRRIDEARRLLLDGLSPSEVAIAVGFHDQPHLNRHFKKYLDTTPGRFQQSAISS